jgi:hypothetical protein
MCSFEDSRTTTILHHKLTEKKMEFFATFKLSVEQLHRAGINHYFYLISKGVSSSQALKEASHCTGVAEDILDFFIYNETGKGAKDATV